MSQALGELAYDAGGKIRNCQYRVVEFGGVVPLASDRGLCPDYEYLWWYAHTSYRV